MIEAFDNLMTIELNEYGFQIDTAWLYFAIDWRFIFTAIGALVAYKIYKKLKKVW
jgi:hypothetical protein